MAGSMMILLTIALQVLKTMADFEQTCTYSDYYGRSINAGQLNACGEALTDMVMFKCQHHGVNLGGDYDFSSIKRKRDIRLSSEEASSYLSPRSKRSFNTGIVCECCIHHCTMTELSQYCAHNDRARRSVRQVITGVQAPPKPAITEQDIHNVYKALEEGTFPGDFVIAPEKYQQMQYIEQTKRQNIEQKYAQLLGIGKLDTLPNVDNSYNHIDTETSGQLLTSEDSASQLIVDTLKDIHLTRHHKRRNSLHHRA